MIDFQKSLETEKVLLRPICQEDFDEMKELTKDEKVWDYFTSNLAVKEQLFRWIQTAVEAMNNQERLAFSIIDKEHKKIIGQPVLGIFLKEISVSRLGGPGSRHRHVEPA
ncbi:GNAT family N-acetyltransferase [Christiangramia flava]|uniref:Uncharacterized protein n=1 Tax=Christiangramia flava JLT2011 TaxID=1229726 RepID=A0A1L7I4N5_9FLAO|nr:GNAT family N-acetyltransferase [Christiangramia flava]APU68556.1 hypothetical protein GRFL_1832 [Christiangramia flava JLT2011]OSS40657.1 hypothetical protein C723_0066 [Christiangramia flava JLT2011]